MEMVTHVDPLLQLAEPGCMSVLLSSGWPTSTIWSSFDVDVSKLERSLISSRSSGFSPWASSMIKTTFSFF